MDNIKKATVKKTGETLNVYRLNNGNYYDYDNMDCSKPCSAPKSGKKEFKPNDLTFN